MSISKRAVVLWVCLKKYTKAWVPNSLKADRSIDTHTLSITNLVGNQSLVNTSCLSYNFPFTTLICPPATAISWFSFFRYLLFCPTQFLINAIWLSPHPCPPLSLARSLQYPQVAFEKKDILSTTLIIPVFKAAPRRRTNFTFLPSRCLPSSVHFSCIPLIHQRAITLLFPAASINPLSSIPSRPFVPLCSPSSSCLFPISLLLYLVCCFSPKLSLLPYLQYPIPPYVII